MRIAVSLPPQRQFDPDEVARMRASREGVCTGFAPGSSAPAVRALADAGAPADRLHAARGA